MFCSFPLGIGQNLEFKCIIEASNNIKGRSRNVYKSNVVRYVVIQNILNAQIPQNSHGCTYVQVCSTQTKRSRRAGRDVRCCRLPAQVCSIPGLFNTSIIWICTWYVQDAVQSTLLCLKERCQDAALVGAELRN